MNYGLEITDEAAANLLAISRWYVERSQSLEVAAAWHDGFLEAIDELKSNPWRGSVAPEASAVGFELREIHYESGKRLTHRALYRIAGNTVQVLSIRHFSQQPIKPGDL